MPLKKGVSPEVVSSNIREMVKSGYKQKQAVAASLAMKRKSKKMSAGGMVEGDEEENSSLGDFMERANPEAQDDARMLAEALNKRAEAAESYAAGGVVAPVAEAPVEETPPAGSSSLSDEAHAALVERKKKRRFLQ